MPAVPTEPSYTQLTDLVGKPANVTFEGDTFSLWVESVSTPEIFGNHRSYSVRLTGPPQPTLGHGAYLLHTAHDQFHLVLEPVARDMRFLHYEAFLTD
jgi:hypothetical protein